MKKASPAHKSKPSRSVLPSWFPRISWGLNRPPHKGISLEEDRPLRAELFGVSQLEDHARIIAAGHRVETVRGPERREAERGSSVAARSAAPMGGRPRKGGLR